MKEQLVKNSNTLGRDAHYTRTVRQHIFIYIMYKIEKKNNLIVCIFSI